MKIDQKEAFQPITITLETKAEAEAFWGVVEAGQATEEKIVKDLAIRISDWFVQSSHL